MCFTPAHGRPHPTPLAEWLSCSLAGLDASARAKYAIERHVSQSSDNKRPSLVERAATSTAGAVEARGERAAGSATSSGASSSNDVAIVCGLSDDGQGLDIIRKRGERLETGTVRRLEQGKPIHGEVVRLRPREQFPMVCDVEVELAGPTPQKTATLSGPAQVATDSYRKNWDAIYGGRKPDPALN